MLVVEAYVYNQALVRQGEFMRAQSPSRSDSIIGSPCRGRGFTIVELMVTIAVAAILLVIAVPSFTNIINTNRLNSAANAMIGALNTARMAAIQQNTSAQFCSNATGTNTSDTLGTACGGNAGEVFVLTPAASGTTATKLAEAPAELGASSIQIHGTVAAIRYNSQGLGYAPGTTTPYSSSTSGNGPVVDLCSTALSTNNHIQISMAAGSIISSTPSTGSCP